MAVQRRRRESKTDYDSRLRTIASGKPRLVARISLRNISLQIVKYERDGDVVKASSHSSELKKYDWPYNKTNISSAYLLGLLMAEKAKKNNINEAIFDIGLKRAAHGGVLFSILKGAVDGGLNIPHNPDAFPRDERINGSHIAEYAKKIDKESYSKRFGNYIKLGAKPEDITKKFNDAKEKILKGEE